MREILFRGRTADGVWIQGYFFQSIGVENNVMHDFIMKNVTNIDVLDGKPFQASYIIEPETVGQYTGLNDRNGTKIFEGDILESPVKRARKLGWESTVRMIVKDIRKIDSSSIALIANEYNVVGNIYDNPELLEGKCEVKANNE